MALGDHVGRKPGCCLWNHGLPPSSIREIIKFRAIYFLKLNPNITFMQCRPVQSIALFVIYVGVSAHLGAHTLASPPASRVANLQTPAQRMEAAQSKSNIDADSALEQLNFYRKLMGLSVLVKNGPLTSAALRHSLYRSVILADNKDAENFYVDGAPGSHFQMLQNPYFSGKTLKDRVVREGYPSNATEVSTSGSRKSGAEFINQMIASVYHRSGVLGFQWDEAGFGVIDKEPVMVLGESRKTTDLPVQPVVFPPPESVIEPVGFKNERPDPLPDYATQWKGLPISVHAAKGQVLDIRKFELVNESGQVVPGRLLTPGNDKRLGQNEAYLVPYAPLNFGQKYRASITLVSAGKLHEMNWGFRLANDQFNVKPTDAVVAKPEDAIVFNIRKNMGSVSVGIESSGQKINAGALVPEQDGFDYAIKIPKSCDTGCSYNFKFNGELNAKTITSRIEVPRQSGKFPVNLLSAVEDLNKSANGRFKALAYSQQLGKWVWASVAGSDKRSVEESALTGCRQMASKEGLAEPCLIY